LLGFDAGERKVGTGAQTDRRACRPASHVWKPSEVNTFR